MKKLYIYMATNGPFAAWCVPEGSKSMTEFTELDRERLYDVERQAYFALYNPGNEVGTSV